jgi:hypothetical protein
MDDQNSNQSSVPVQDAPVVDGSIQTDQSINQSATGDRVQAVRSKALGALVSSLDSLEGPVERKYELLMGALRSSFDEDILEKALETALKIEDPSARAEALLDIVSETDVQTSSK